MAIRTGAANARNSSPAVSSTALSCASSATAKLETVFIMGSEYMRGCACQRRPRPGLPVCVREFYVSVVIVDIRPPWRRSRRRRAESTPRRDRTGAPARYAVNPWLPSSTPLRTWRNAVAWSTNPARSTVARSRRGTTGRWASSSRRTSSGSGGGRWSPVATTSSAWTARSSCRARCGWPPVTSRCSTIRWSNA